MIEREKIEELLSLPVEERRRVVQLLQESLAEAEELSTANGQISPGARWLLSRAGRYKGGPGNTAGRSDEILRTEIDRHRGFKTN